ncbi:hypothetical protein [Thalassomonas sp. RHCl1]|uniref:hypothetical protein n=1 Tax=Thalassomonas sp. RHCl1 TaxID=2995320 RepID=UPI00248C6EF6|nr:hypothetical protein [Thalassomonas sp. RHCl1]
MKIVTRKQNYFFLFIISICFSLPALAQMRGGVDNTSDNSVYGWACQRLNVDAVDISIYVGGDIQQGTLLKRMQTNTYSTWDVRGQCDYTSYKHRFHYTFTPEQQLSFRDQAIYVYVHEPVTDTPVQLASSGYYTVPGITSEQVILFEDHFDGIARPSARDIGWASAANDAYSDPKIVETGSGQLKTNPHIYAVPNHDFSNIFDALHPDTSELRLKVNLSGYNRAFSYYFGLGAPIADDPDDYQGYAANIQLTVDAQQAVLTLRGRNRSHLAGANMGDPKHLNLTTVELRIAGDFSLNQTTMLASVYISDQLLMSDIPFTWYQGQNHLFLYADNWFSNNDPLPVRFDSVRLTAGRGSQSCPAN